MGFFTSKPSLSFVEKRIDKQQYYIVDTYFTSGSTTYSEMKGEDLSIYLGSFEENGARGTFWCFNSLIVKEQVTHIIWKKK